MAKKYNSGFHNSPFLVLFSIAMAVSFFMCSPIPSMAAPSPNEYIVFYRTSATVSSVIGGTTSDYLAANLGSYYYAYDSLGKILVGTMTTIYQVTNKNTGAQCYAQTSSSSSYVYIPFVITDDKLNNDTITSTIKGYLDSQTSTIITSNNNIKSALEYDIDNQTQVLLDAIRNSGTDPMLLQNFPTNTGMSYTNIYGQSPLSYSTFYLTNLGDHYFRFTINCTLSEDILIPSGSFLTTLPFSPGVISGSYPDAIKNGEYKFLSSYNSYPTFKATAASPSTDGVTVYFDSQYNYYTTSLTFYFYIYSDKLSNKDYQWNYTYPNTAYQYFYISDIVIIQSTLKNLFNQNNTNTQQIINNANKNADNIMHSYDSSSQQSDNQRFDSSQKELQQAEDSLFSSASDGFNGLDFSLYSLDALSGMTASFSFVSGFLQSVYLKMGDFGKVVLIGLAVMIASKILGIYRFSSGGDDGG